MKDLRQRAAGALLHARYAVNSYACHRPRKRTMQPRGAFTLDRPLARAMTTEV